MTRSVVIVLAAFVVGCVIVLAIVLADRADDHTYEHVETTSGTTPTTVWPTETVPNLGARFDELIAHIERAKHRALRRRLFKAAMAQPSKSSGYPCGGDLPPCYVLERESLMASDPPRVWNGNCYMPTGSLGQCGSSSASGLWQFLRSTWNNFGGYVNAADAPVDVQNAKARLVWAGGAGCSHWAAC